MLVVVVLVLVLMVLVPRGGFGTLCRRDDVRIEVAGERRYAWGIGRICRAGIGRAPGRNFEIVSTRR